MYQLRYYYSKKDYISKNNNFEIVGNYYNEILAKGMRKKKSALPQYNINLLVIKKIES